MLLVHNIIANLLHDFGTHPTAGLKLLTSNPMTVCYFLSQLNVLQHFRHFAT